MAAYFFDSCALVKRYAREAGTAWMLGLVRPSAGNVIYAVRITYVETTAAIARKRRGTYLPPLTAERALARVRRDFAHRFVITEVTPRLCERAAHLANKHHLRGYDAVQLAAVLENQDERTRMRLSSLVFVTADDDLLIAAPNEGLLTDNPENH
jgi:predicted nucleic acid-binding protein